MPQNRSQAAPSRSHPTLVLTGGGSGGHITPLLSLARALKRQDPAASVIYIGLKGDKTKGLQSRYGVFDAAYFIASGKFRRYHGQGLLRRLLDVKTFFLNVRDSFRVLAGIITARRLMRKIKPDLVFSKGGFVAVPVGIAAKMRSIPIVTHDSDALPGLANRVIGRWAALHTTGMPPEYYPYPPKSTKQVGIPLDERIKPVTAALLEEYRQQIQVSPKDRVLVVGGAGLGSRDINSLVLAAAPRLLADIPSLKIFHFTGDAHHQEVERRYQEILPADTRARVKVFGFRSDFYKYTGAADLVISRAGATTIAELALQKKASILIPATFLAGGHQLKNAQRLLSLGAVELAENSVEPQEFIPQVESLLADDNKRRLLSEKIGAQAHPSAAEDLAEILLRAASGSPGRD